MDVHDYLTGKEWKFIKAFADKQETPFLVVLLDIVKEKFLSLRKHLPYAQIFYAVKANPATEIIALLDSLGSSFDVASVYELRKLLALGISPDRLSCGNTIKKKSDIEEFYKSGVRLFVTDSETDLRNIAAAAPKSKVFVRVLTEGFSTADWPLSRKFGCQTEMAIELFLLARKLGLIPYGISFHVGSQQRDISMWNAALGKTRYIIDWLCEEGIELKCVNMGGGFPGNYMERGQSIKEYAKGISHYLEENFTEGLPEIIIEPGRYIAADAGVIVSEVVLSTKKSKTSLERWVFTDVGKFNGLMETLNESIKYPIISEAKGELEEVILAGPTCDSMDTTYEDYKYEFPAGLRPGDRLYWLSAGAYTASYSSVDFNGFPPLRTFHIWRKP